MVRSSRPPQGPSPQRCVRGPRAAFLPPQRPGRLGPCRPCGPASTPDRCFSLGLLAALGRRPPLGARHLRPLPLLMFLTSRGIGVREAGQVAALYGVGILVAGPVVGTLADVLNRWPTMVGSLLCAAFPLPLGSGRFSVRSRGRGAPRGGERGAQPPGGHGPRCRRGPGPGRTRACGMLRWGNTGPVGVRVR